jgi:hypothetical protein
MTINQGRHHPTNLMRCAARPPEHYGDVDLSVQASRFHASGPRNGCGHTPLELYARVEVALRWANAKGRAPRWIRQPGRELGIIAGFDDLWSEEVAIAEYVPQERVTALREMETAVDRRWSDLELEVDAIDGPAPVTGAEREAGLI